jgi:FkbM family methyltransferase
MDTITLTIHGGARIRVPNALDQITPYVLLEQEDWFEDEIRFVRTYLEPGAHALDIGANFGVYTVAMAQAVGGEGSVQAFEPTPATAAVLRATVAENDARQVRVHQLAVSDRAGTARLSLHAESELNALSSGGQGIEVQTATLDELAAEHDWPRVGFVKIDAEGHEPQVIAGGARLFREHSPLVMFEVKAGGRIDFTAAERFLELGYDPYYLLPGPMLLVPFNPRQVADPFLLNLLCCKPDRAQDLARRGLLAPRSAPCDVSARAAQAAWGKLYGAMPYASALSLAWPRGVNWFTKPDAKAYLEGLYLYAWSRAGAIGTAQRLGLLTSAHARVTEAVARRATLPRLLTQARLSWELGRRAEALGALRVASERVEAEADSVRREPFLPPLPRYEQIRPGNSASEWVACALAEALEKLGAFSSVFTGVSSLAIVESIAHSPLRSPEMERRRQLMRMRAGMQAGPQSSPLLAARSDDNLNPQYWCATAKAV